MYANAHPPHRVALLIVAMTLLATRLTAQESEVALPEGFLLESVIENLSEPIALAAGENGDLLIGEKGGRVLLLPGGEGTAQIVREFTVYDNSECGLLGLATAPDYVTTGNVFAFITVEFNEQRIVRFSTSDPPDLEPIVIRDNLPTNGQFHNGGGLRVGSGEMLYFSIGDTGEPQLSQDFNTFAGKLCRVNLDGTTPTDNPFVTPTGTPRAIYALGFRNPFRFCHAPDGRLFVMDVGSNGDARREEINLVTAGDNGGWPDAEGTATGDGYIDPIYEYVDEGAAITGCAFHASGVLPSAYDESLFHIDFVSNRIFRLGNLDSDGPQHSVFYTGSGGMVDLVMMPSGDLVFTEMLTGRVMRLRNTNAPAEDSGGDSDGSDPPVSGPSPCGAGALLTFAVLSGSLGLVRCARCRSRLNASSS